MDIQKATLVIFSVVTNRKSATILAALLRSLGLEVFLAEWVDINLRATVKGSPLWLLLEQAHSLDKLW